MEVLRYEFLDEVKRIQYKYWNELLSAVMEENTCLETHLTRMFDTYERLTEVWDYWMDDSFAIKAVLCSLPPSYKGVVAGYIPQVDRLYFNEFLRQLLKVKVEPIAGESSIQKVYLIYLLL